MIIVVAWLIDHFLGEPPSQLHPVVWMGSYLRAVRKRLPPTMLAGALAWLGGAVLGLGGAQVVNWVIVTASNLLSKLLPISPNLQSLVSILLYAAALKPLFAWAALYAAGQAVLSAPDLPAARRLLSWHLVTQQKTDVRTWSTPMYGGYYGPYNRYAGYSCWSCGVGYTTDVTVDNYTQGTFIVDLIDPKLRRSVWRSFIQSRLKGQLSRDQAAYNETAAALFASFPPGAATPGAAP